jgi:hypothetical protein
VLYSQRRKRSFQRSQLRVISDVRRMRKRSDSDRYYTTVVQPTRLPGSAGLWPASCIARLKHIGWCISTLSPPSRPPACGGLGRCPSRCGDGRDRRDNRAERRRNRKLNASLRSLETRLFSRFSFPPLSSRICQKPLSLLARLLTNLLQDHTIELSMSFSN